MWFYSLFLYFLESETRELFRNYGIIGEVTTIKIIWLELTYASILLKLMVCRRYLKLPGFSYHLIVCCASAALQSTKIWGLLGEVWFSLTAIAFCWELHFTSCVSVRYPIERRYILGSVTSIAIGSSAVGFLYGAPSPNQWLTHLHFYTVCAAFGAAMAILWIHAKRRTTSNEYLLVWPAALWFGASAWAGVMPRNDFFRVGASAVLIQIGCLITWLQSYSR